MKIPGTALPLYPINRPTVLVPTHDENVNAIYTTGVEGEEPVGLNFPNLLIRNSNM
jgi:hypothetical protein